MKLVGHISFVDVPGHETFMSNMISGSAVMNACILVIASNENIPQPQTYEHFEAVKNINIDKFIILQNKIDLIEESLNQKILDDIFKHLESHLEDDFATFFIRVSLKVTLQNNVNDDSLIRISV